MITRRTVLTVCFFLFCPGTQASDIYFDRVRDVFDGIDRMELIMGLPPEEKSMEEMQGVYDEFMEGYADFIIVSTELLPKKYWQYVVPAYYASPLIPDKVKEYEPFKPYEGRKPVDIPPHMREFADKYLDVLDPNYYSVFMPKEETDEMMDILGSRAAFLEYIGYLPKKHEPRVVTEYEGREEILKTLPDRVPFDYFSSGEYVNYKPDASRNKKIKVNTVLKGGDVLAFLNSLPEVMYAFVKAREENPMDYKTAELKMGIDNRRMLKLARSNMPCRFFISRLTENESGRISDIIKKDGFTLDEWAIVCDKTIKAYHLSNLNPNIRFELMVAKLKRDYLLGEDKFPKEMKRDMLDRLNLKLSKYDGDPKDVPAVNDFKAEVREVFETIKFLQFMQTRI